MFVKGIYSTIIFRVANVFFIYISFVVVISLAVSTFDRFLSVKYALLYQKVAGTRKALFAIATVWIIPTTAPTLFVVLVKSWAGEAAYSFSMVLFIFVTL